MKWVVVTSERQYEVTAERHVDAEKIAWDKHKAGEEILYITPKAIFLLSF